MMKRLLIALLVLATQSASSAGDVTNAVKLAVITSKAIGMLTTNDVPAKWQLSSDTSVEKKYTTTTFRRGSNTVMELRWPTDWIEEEKRDYFTGHLLDGTTQVARLLGGPPRSISVVPRVPPRQYTILVHTSLETNSAVTVTGTNGFSETYILDGRDTAPMGELDYTKMRFFQDFAWKPLADTVTNKMERSPNQQVHCTQ
jgi:hypothetical protein